ncbi:MAG: type II toxin-antitoxin system RelE/ParE family toxin [Acidobacteria bacterium]|nr:type II toxin-antitoxin system RelE/ParE family toxin [Acidobacteriota bacterium]
MKSVRLTLSARADVQSIWTYLAEQSGSSVADRIRHRITDEFRKIAQMPGRGHRRSDLTKHPVLFVRVYQILIAYQPNDAQGILIVAILHGRRNLVVELRRRIR